jgi:hypothetical protein
VYCFRPIFSFTGLPFFLSEHGRKCLYMTTLYIKRQNNAQPFGLDNDEACKVIDQDNECSVYMPTK